MEILSANLAEAIFLKPGADPADGLLRSELFDTYY